MTDIQKIKDILASADVIHTEEEVAAAVSRVARQITEKLGETNPLLLVVMSGGVPFAGRPMAPVARSTCTSAHQRLAAISTVAASEKPRRCGASRM